MKTPFNNFDIVRFNAAADINTSNQHAKDYIGIVKEASAPNSFVEWYDCKSKTSTREVTDLTGWIINSALEVVGSLWHVISEKNISIPTMATSAAATPVVRTKRKYVRKAGSAKPGPKPKKAPKAAKEIVTEIVNETPVVSQVIKVPVPLNKYRQPLDRKWFETVNRHCIDVIATGKFKHFPTRPYVEKSITDSGFRLTHKIDWGLDFAIVGEKPGPSKIERFKYLGTPMLTEEQYLALIGAPGFEFETA